ncbi:Zinc metalloproteinase nas-23 [Dissostichus eleginoides]|uniref:Zinc metalloproteinase nas-23 n=1 Tax=Dissostichus eleginoides TaxID=100907 RepID=A0AAD9CVE4_DISEL|nr:Zinc metalloproteinase nas-23 [Dissostichus eleginoides]
MSAIGRRGAPEPYWGNTPSRNPDFKRPRRLLARLMHPVSIWLPDGPLSAHHAHRSPKYVSFVNKAILWDRGLCHYTDVGASGEKSPGPLGLRGPVKGGHCLTIESRKLL